MVDERSGYYKVYGVPTVLFTTLLLDHSRLAHLFGVVFRY